MTGRLSSSVVPASVSSRLRREDYKYTKHDTHFSKWRVLIGPSDWEDYSLGKEGAAKYRVHNLPRKSGPGLYELGIAVSRSGLGSEAGKFVIDDIVVVYLGQADNVRSRLQQYGRSGAHLANSYENGQLNHGSETKSTKKGLGLFEEIFPRGHSIVFRWAPMEAKRNAEKTEAQLLETFDYAWNKGSNGTRRPDDIFQKLSEMASSTNRFSWISRRVLFIPPSRVGIKIESGKPVSPEKSDITADKDSKSFLHGIFKFNRSQPKLVSEKSGITEELTQICGYIMTDAVPCRRPPVPERKRCEEHKGMRNYVRKSKPIAEFVSSYYNDQDWNACGVNFGDGNCCRKQAVSGRRRCEEHKGMGINSRVSKPIAEEKCHSPASSSVSSTTSSNFRDNDSSSLKTSLFDESLSTICGADIGNGSLCDKPPIAGIKRCLQHKGKRADSTISIITCGVALQNAMCMNPPVKGRKRCEHHKGMRVSSKT